jgi:hypothetical protein
MSTAGKEKAQRAAGLFHDDSRIGTPRLTSLDFGPQLKLTVNRATPLSACVSIEHVKSSPERSDETTGFWPLFFGKKPAPPVQPPFPYKNHGVLAPPYTTYDVCNSASF